MTFQFRTFCVGISSFSPDRERSNGLVGQRGVRKSENNPMKQDLEKHSGSKERDGLCKAKTRSGSTCGRPPIRGRARCRLHGGLSPGAPRGTKNGNYRAGQWTAEAIEERRWLRSLVKAFAAGM
jgi:hypothetical protein